MAFTTTMLSWSVIEFGGFMGSELANAKTAIRWATDYLLKATAHLPTIYVQVNIVQSHLNLCKLNRIKLCSPCYLTIFASYG